MSNIFILLSADIDVPDLDGIGAIERFRRRREWKYRNCFYDRNSNITEILKRLANDVHSTEDIRTLQTYHDQLPNGLSRHYLATLIQYYHCLSPDINSIPIGAFYNEIFSHDAADPAAPSGIDSIGALAPSEQKFLDSVYQCLQYDLNLLPHFFKNHFVLIISRALRSQLSSLLLAKTFDEQHFQALIQFLSYRSAFAENELTTHSDINLPIIHWLDGSKSSESLPSLSETIEAINDLEDDNTQYVRIKELLHEVGKLQAERGVHPNHWLRAFSELRMAQAIRLEIQIDSHLERNLPFWLKANWLKAKTHQAPLTQGMKRKLIGDDTFFGRSEQNKKARQDDLETELATPRP